MTFKKYISGILIGCALYFALARWAGQPFDAISYFFLNVWLFVGGAWLFYKSFKSKEMKWRQFDMSLTHEQGVLIKLYLLISNCFLVHLFSCSIYLNSIEPDLPVGRQLAAIIKFFLVGLVLLAFLNHIRWAYHLLNCLAVVVIPVYVYVIFLSLTTGKGHVLSIILTFCIHNLPLLLLAILVYQKKVKDVLYNTRLTRTEIEQIIKSHPGSGMIALLKGGSIGWLFMFLFLILKFYLVNYI